MDKNFNQTDDGNKINTVGKEKNDIDDKNDINKENTGIYNKMTKENAKSNNTSNLVPNSDTKKIKDITEEINSNEIILFNESINIILNKILNEPNLEYYDFYRIRRTDNAIALENDDTNETHLLFIKNFTVYYKNYYLDKDYITLVDKSVNSSLRIEKVMEHFNIKNLQYEKSKRYSYPSFKLKLLDIIDNNENINFICPFDELKFKYNNFCINKIPKLIDLNSLSKYSNNYFKYSDNIVEYIETEERKQFLDDLLCFKGLNNINIFKVTGPSHNGKSITLLIYSRMKNNIIYFNLKYIMKLYYSSNKDYLKVMMNELGRAILTDEQILKINKIFESTTSNEPWRIIEQLVELLINKNVLFILDQFNEKTIDFKIYNMIEKKLTESTENKLKIVICSSINDYMIKSEVIKTIRLFYGNPPIFEKRYENYYFYINNLLDINKLKLISEQKENKNSDYFKDFNYDPKYIYKFSNSNDCLKTFIEITSHIKKNIIENYKEKDVSSDDILFYSSLNVGKELKYNENLDILTYISLKYFTLDLQKEYFKINYSFNYIAKLIKDININNNVEDFFQKEKTSYFYKRLQPDYFEQSCIFSLRKGNILPKISHILNVNTITELEEEEDDENNRNKNLGKFNTLTLQEYYNINISKIEELIKELKNKKDEEDINRHQYEGLKLQKDKLKNLLNKKRYKIKNESGIEEEIDISKKEKNIYQYKEDFNNGGIIINQNNKGGKIVDFGFLYGESQSKTFIGFQIKKYSKNIKLNHDIKENLNKDKIKANLRKFLAQALIEYKFKIQEWHYFLISFYNPINKEYNEDIVRICEKEGLEYLFYYPKDHTFFDKKFNNINSQLNLTFNSNLDYGKDNNPELVFDNFHSNYENAYKYCKFSAYKKQLLEKANTFIKSYSDIKLIDINRNIKNKCDKIENLNLVAIFNYNRKAHLPIPNNSYLFLFISSNKDDFIYHCRINNKFYSGFVIKDEKLEPFFISKYINDDEKHLRFLAYRCN